MAKAVSRSKKSNKKSQSGFLSRYFHSWWGWLILVVLLLMASFCAYKYIRYQSAPAEIKLIRQDPIYSYESENLKIVKISEDYGGKDWKGVYHGPVVRIWLTKNNDWLNGLQKVLTNSEWELSDVSKVDGSGDRYYYRNQEKNLSLSFKESTDYTILIIRATDDKIINK